MADLTHAAEVVSQTLDGMSGATSPKLQLELMCAKVLVPAADQSEVGSLARIDRLERRIGMGGAAVSVAAVAEVTAAPAAAAAPVISVGLDTDAFKNAWQEILGVVNKANKAAWMLAFGLQVVDFQPNDSVLTLQFTSAMDLESFKSSSNAPDILRKAIDQVLGVTVKFKPQIAEANAQPKTEVLPVVAEVEVTEGEDIDETEFEESVVEEVVVEEKKPAPKSRNSKLVNEGERYGDSVLREVLGAEPVDDKKNR
jgi:DNA polymerase-3 subunit gamma/tau